MKKKVIVYLDNTRFGNLTNVSFEAGDGASICWELKGNGTLQVRIEKRVNGKWRRETVALYPSGSWTGFLATELAEWDYKVKY